MGQFDAVQQDADAVTLEVRVVFYFRIDLNSSSGLGVIDQLLDRLGLGRLQLGEIAV